ncbi:hypothetical protein FNF29_05242 [Cafeteria roenbergensis]|uniref:Uncharacterized protein n=1 Tax=Cafeteria roenbergensis TaxID=33653 RepID=A0A5A8CCQ3_CAFRO|nr:hypothetical protein FNF29_05242 [Cafeteria roenbergensis]|eukprot:KAA0150439.1 hypothetical protein FNF29_05242 [Cafeteria roenbergensis]
MPLSPERSPSTPATSSELDSGFDDVIAVPYAWEGARGGGAAGLPATPSPTAKGRPRKTSGASLDGVGTHQELSTAHRRFAAITSAAKSGAFTVPEAPPQERDDVPGCWILLLALPQLSMTSLTMLLNVHLLSFYSRLGAPIALMTLFITIARSTDAITDPGVSWLTDSGLLRLCWRPGVRRKPIMLVGPLLYNAAMVMLLGTPIEFADNGIAWAAWFGGMQTLFYFGDTLCSIPLSAMMPAMSTNTGTRESIFMSARGVNSLGILIAALAPVPLGWMLREDSCYAANCAQCPDKLPGANATIFGMTGSEYYDCRSSCESICDVEGSRKAFRYLGWAFAAWHLVTMWLVVFLVPEPGVERRIFDSRRADEPPAPEGDGASDGEGLSKPGPVPTAQGATAAAAETTSSAPARPQARPAGCCERLSDRCAFTCAARPSDPDLSDLAIRNEPIVAAFQKTLRNSAFVALVPTTVLDMVAFTLVGTAMKLYVDYVVQPTAVPACAGGSRTILGFTSTFFCTSNDVWLGMALFALMLSMILFIPVWRLLSALFGTRQTWLLFNLVGAVTTALFVFGGEGAPIPSVLLSFVNGIPQAAMFLNDAILSTTIDYDAVLNQGERAEARFSMFSSLTPKLASVPAQALPLSILAAIGFVEPVRGVLQPQPGHVRFYISAMFFIFPTIIALISWLVKLRFPIRHQEQLDRISHNYRLLTGKVQAAWHEKILLRDPLDPSLAGGASRERPWCCCCRQTAKPQDPAKRSKAGRALARRQQPSADGRASANGGEGVRRRAGGSVAPAPAADSSPEAVVAKHTIRLYPRVTLTERDHEAFAVFDQFNVQELGAWRVFGLRFLRERTNRARCCRVASTIAFGLAAAAQVALGMLEQSAMSWLPTVTMLAFGLMLLLAVMSSLKLHAVPKLNSDVCGGPSGHRFTKWLRANAMALRLNAMELELVDTSHADAVRQHQEDDEKAKHVQRPSDGPSSPGAALAEQSAASEMLVAPPHMGSAFEMPDAGPAPAGSAEAGRGSKRPVASGSWHHERPDRTERSSERDSKSRSTPALQGMLDSVEEPSQSSDGRGRDTSPRGQAAAAHRAAGGARRTTSRGSRRKR